MEIRRIAVVGAIGPRKGAAILELCAKYAAEHEASLRFVVLGYTDRDERLRALGNVEIVGRYSRRNELELLQRLRADVIWITSVTPETYLYTLSAALQTDLPIVAFDLGAVAERSRANTNCVLLPLGVMGEAGWLVEFFENQSFSREPREFVPVAYPSILADYYGFEASSWDDDAAT